jgi:hypothetical protein
LAGRHDVYLAAYPSPSARRHYAAPSRR